MKMENDVGNSAECIVDKILADFEARYPTDIWPEGGKSTDCRSARFARKIIANIRREIAEAFNEPLTGQADKDCSVKGVVEEDFLDGGQRASCPVEGSTLPPPDGFNMDEIKHKAYLYDVIMEMLREEGVKTDGIHVPSTFKKMARIFTAGAGRIADQGEEV